MVTENAFCGIQMEWLSGYPHDESRQKHFETLYISSSLLFHSLSNHVEKRAKDIEAKQDPTELLGLIENLV